MKNEEFYQQIQPILDQLGDDALFVCHFSKSDDAYQAKTINLDAGDALILITRLMERFNLNAEAIALMSAQS